MNRTCVSVICLTVAIVLSAVLYLPQPAVHAENNAKPKQWEYKIYRTTDSDFASGKTEAEVNRFASEGWEFVETMLSRPPQTETVASPLDRSLASTTCLLFKREKR